MVRQIHAVDRQMFVREPLRFQGSIPVFSESNVYTANYEQIADDHLVSLRETGSNPFIPERLWVQTEASTVSLIKKHSKAGDRILDVGVGLGRLLSLCRFLFMAEYLRALRCWEI